ncbi:MAG: PTS sugar transporter subunit IIA [Gemmatimonadetes bacterium]|nr:PTS sugar transporter subunit IIA [Gemmatimonadota bacterium]
MRIQDILVPEATLRKPGVRAREVLLRELVDRLAKAGRVLDRDRVYDDLLIRESEQGTGLGHGVAIPHCRSEGVDELSAAFALCPEGVAFESVDGKPCRFVVVLLSPLKADMSHVQALARVARLLRRDEVQQELLAAASVDDLNRILLSHDE